MVARWLRRWLPFALIAWGQASLATNVPGTDNIHFRTFGPAQGMSHCAGALPTAGNGAEKMT